MLRIHAIVEKIPNLMKKIFRLLLLIFFSNILTSCDPSQHIAFINKTDSDVKIRFNLNSKIEDFELSQITKSDSIVYNLKKNDTATIYYGIGTWSTNETAKFANSINNLEIETKDVKFIYKSKKAIKDILDKNIKGILVKNLIEIKVEQ